MLATGTAVQSEVAADPQQWVGRTELAEGRLTPDLAGMLQATLSHQASPAIDIAAGAPLPPLWHWAAFNEHVPMEGLARDGHPALGRFLPPLPYARRMWAGSRLSWEGGLTIGERLRRLSEIVAITEKDGTTGPMVFVRVAHDVTGAQGRIREEQDIVYLDIPDRFRPPRRIPPPQSPDFAELVPMSEARLFRYSAATFNAHRIHYDLAYAREVEKYPALVVHGPLQATLLIEAACRFVSAPPRRFRFKSVYPMFHDQPARIQGTRDGGGAVELCSVAHVSGHQCMQARLEFD